MGQYPFPCYPAEGIAEGPLVVKSSRAAPDASFPETAWDGAGGLEQTLNAALVDSLETSELAMARTVLTWIETGSVDLDHQTEQECVAGDMVVAWAYQGWDVGMASELESQVVQLKLERPF